MFGGRIATKIDRIALAGEQRAATQKSTVAVAASIREDYFGRRRCQDRFEMATVRKRDGQGIELDRPDYVIRDEAILGDRSWPTRRVQAEQADVAAG